MMALRFQVAPPGATPIDASHSVSGAPPTISIRFSLPSAKNAIDRLSGDHVGKSAELESESESVP
jgi:hypothetical protein